MFEKKIDASMVRLNPSYRMSLHLSPTTQKAIELCRRKLGLENRSMVVRRAIASYVNQNLTGEELERLTE